MPRCRNVFYFIRAAHIACVYPVIYKIFLLWKEYGEEQYVMLKR